MSKSTLPSSNFFVSNNEEKIAHTERHFSPLKEKETSRMEIEENAPFF